MLGLMAVLPVITRVQRPHLRHWLQRGFQTILLKGSFWPRCLRPASLSPIVPTVSAVDPVPSTHQIVLCAPSFHSSCSWSPAQHQQAPLAVPRLPVGQSHHNQLEQGPLKQLLLVQGLCLSLAVLIYQDHKARQHLAQTAQRS